MGQLMLKGMQTNTIEINGSEIESGRRQTGYATLLSRKVS